MIYTVTLNPTVDVRAESDAPVAGGRLNRIRVTGRQLGGKGWNVSRALGALGEENTALVALDEEDAKAFGDKLPRAVTAVYLGGRCRTCYDILSPGDLPREVVHTEINEAGEENPGVGERAQAVLRGLLRPGDTVLVAGSLPAGTPPSVYEAICRTAADAGALAVADCAGENLLAAIRGGASLIKPNVSELCSLPEVDDRLGELLAGLPDPVSRLDGLSDVASAVALGRGIEVLVTAGEDGAVYAAPDGSVILSPTDPVKSAGVKGAGDTYLGAFLSLRRRFDLPEAMHLAGRIAGVYLSSGTVLKPRELPPEETERP